MKFALSGVFLMFGLVACAVPSTQSRIAKNGGMYSLLSPEHRQLVASGQITEGMSKDAVFLAWGKPSKTTELQEDGVSKERWIYERSRPSHNTNIGIGYGHSRYGRYGDCFPFGGAHRSYVTEQIAMVVFGQGKVETWERTQ